MEAYELFLHDRCDRCVQPMSARIMSFFNEELICMDCLREERKLLTALRAKEVDVARLESCGFVPRANQYCRRGPELAHVPERRETPGEGKPPAA